MYTFVPFTKQYFTQLVALITDSFKIKNEENERLIEWKLFDPFLLNRTITYIALTQDNQVVGHYSNVPVTIEKDDQDYKGMACIDMTTHPEHRRRGIISELAKRVYKDVVDQGYDLSIGFSNSEGVQVDKNASGYGYVIVGAFAQYAKFKIFSIKTPYKLSPITEIHPTHGTAFYYQVKKDAEYLKWRYLKKPGYRYDLFEVVNAIEETSVVLRIVGRKLYLYDIVTPVTSNEHIKSVISAVENYALSKGIHIVVIPVVDNMFWKKVLVKNGFRKLPLTKKHFYLTVKVHNEEKVSKDIFDSNKWFIMNGDLW